MKKNGLLLLMLSLAVPWAQQALAQADVVVSGANASSAEGSVSYSVGQVAYIQYTGNGGRVSEGVQQAYLITELGTENLPETSFTGEVFPNPTFAGVKLVLHGISSFEGMEVKVQDATGKPVLSHSPLSTENEIPMGHLPAGTYVLGLYLGQGLVKSFKIIKSE